MLTLDDPCEPEPMLGKFYIGIKSFKKIFFLLVLDVFKYDEQYEENEEKYKEIRKTILDESSDDEDESSSDSSDSDEEGGGKKDDVDEEEQEVDEGASKYNSKYTLIFLYSAYIALIRCFS